MMCKEESMAGKRPFTATPFVFCWVTNTVSSAFMRLKMPRNWKVSYNVYSPSWQQHLNAYLRRKESLPRYQLRSDPVAIHNRRLDTPSSLTQYNLPLSFQSYGLAVKRNKLRYWTWSTIVCFIGSFTSSYRLITMHVKWNTVEVAEFCEEHHCSCAFWILAGLNVQVLVQRSSVHVDAAKLLQAKLALPVCNLDDIIAYRSGFLCDLQTDRFQHTRNHSESATERLKFCLNRKRSAFDASSSCARKKWSLRWINMRS